MTAIMMLVCSDVEEYPEISVISGHSVLHFIPQGLHKRHSLTISK
jgi:hypothetical protein